MLIFIGGMYQNIFSSIEYCKNLKKKKFEFNFIRFVLKIGHVFFFNILTDIIKKVMLMNADKAIINIPF